MVSFNISTKNIDYSKIKGSFTVEISTSPPDWIAG